MTRCLPRLCPSTFRALTATILALALVTLPLRPAFATDTSSAALTVSKQALNAYRAKRYKDAASLYRAAWHTHPDELRYLYNAARSAQLAGQLEDSQRDYVEYLMKATGDGSAVKKARVHLEEVRAALRAQRQALKQAGGTQAPQPPPPASDGSAQRVAGWSMLGIGLATGLASGIVLVGASVDQSELNRLLAMKDANGKIVGITKEASDAENVRLDNQLFLGWGLAAAGVVGLGVGALLLATAPSATPRAAVYPWPNGRGAGLALRF